ncbi:hypothetical protein niasHT_000611 [Heterodera trifolii]|uniref:B30.2/SPRY domain-containing protein n=1 Tax=Heterodera trifolii TaxID=157864 RepID=A0ABD2LZG5_9BILA
MRVNQNALAEKMSKIEAKLEKQIENGKHNNKNGLTANLENGMRAKQKAPLLENMAIAALFHFPLPIYRWNAFDCHPKIVINESTNSIQRNGTGERFLGIRSCRAGPIKMPSASPISIIYTEYRILAENGPLLIGLSTKEMSLDYMVGYGPVSYGYANYRRIEGQNANGNDIIISDNVPAFHIGNVVGCGLNLATRQVFFTKNGQHLNITNLYVDEDTADLYPTVSLTYHGDAVEANFGPNFHYDLSKKF